MSGCTAEKSYNYIGRARIPVLTGVRDPMEPASQHVHQRHTGAVVLTFTPPACSRVSHKFGDANGVAIRQGRVCEQPHGMKTSMPLLCLARADIGCAGSWSSCA